MGLHPYSYLWVKGIPSFSFWGHVLGPYGYGMVEVLTDKAYKLYIYITVITACHCGQGHTAHVANAREDLC